MWGKCSFNCLFPAGYLVICLTDQCNVERLRLWDGFPLSILSYCLCEENLFDAMSLTEFSFLQLILQLGFYNLILDQCRVMREMKYCLLVWVSSTSFQTLLDNGGDGMLSPCLGLYYQLSDLAG